MWIKFFLLIIFIEAITEIVTKSEIFLPIRKFIFHIGQKSKFFSWLHELLDCGYCFSVWVSFGSVLIFFQDLNIMWRFLLFVVLHRLSNLFHNIQDRVHNV